MRVMATDYLPAMGVGVGFDTKKIVTVLVIAEKASKQYLRSIDEGNLMELTIEQTLQNGVAAHNAGKLEEAERLYRAILQSHPAHPDANHNLGLIAVSVNKAEAALPLFKTALEANPKVEQFWLSYIDALIKEKQFDNAKQVLEQAKKQGVARDKVDAIEAQITTTTQLNEPKLVVQKKSLTLLEKRKKLAEQKKQKKAKKQNLKAISPSDTEIKSLLEHYQNGRYDDAEKLAKSITQEFPKHQFGWKVLGAVLIQTGRIADSLTPMQKSVQLVPQDAEAHNNLGTTLQELGRLDEAEASLMQAIALKPDFVEAHYNLGITLKELGRLDEAEASYTQVIALKPDYAEAHSNLGITLNELGRLHEAEASYTQALVLKPDYAEARYNLGNALKGLGRLDEAEASYTQAIALKPDYAEAHNNLGAVLKKLGRLDEAEASLTQATALEPNYAEAHFNVGCFREYKGDLDAAIGSYKQAIKIEPDYAEAFYNTSLVNLKLQDFEAGWPLYEWRWKRTEAFNNPLQSSKPLWKPTKKQRVLLWCEQGVGDEIMFASLIPDLYSSSSKLIVVTDKRLIPLFRRSFPDDIDFRPSNEVVSETEYDSQISMGSVPLHFRQSIDSFKHCAQGWLSASAVKAKNLRSQLLSDDSETLIGISWHTTAHQNGAQNRLIPLNQIAQMLHAPKVRLVSLQYGDFVNEVKKLSTDYGIKVAQVTEIDNMNDIDGLAALISACDRVVSIDNTTVHLAGALGKETKVLLPYTCEWRWGQSSQDSYWYDSVQLYRQTKIGDWEYVIKQL
jgi:tetratricopeptide (TPR) repeat protein